MTRRPGFAPADVARTGLEATSIHTAATYCGAAASCLPERPPRRPCRCTPCGAFSRVRTGRPWRTNFRWAVVNCPCRPLDFTQLLTQTNWQWVCCCLCGEAAVPGVFQRPRYARDQRVVVLSRSPNCEPPRTFGPRARDAAPYAPSIAGIERNLRFPTRLDPARHAAAKALCATSISVGRDRTILRSTLHA